MTTNITNEELRRRVLNNEISVANFRIALNSTIEAVDRLKNSKSGFTENEDLITSEIKPLKEAIVYIQSCVDAFDSAMANLEVNIEKLNGKIAQLEARIMQLEKSASRDLIDEILHS